MSMSLDFSSKYKLFKIMLKNESYEKILVIRGLAPQGYINIILIRIVIVFLLHYKFLLFIN